LIKKIAKNQKEGENKRVRLSRAAPGCIHLMIRKIYFKGELQWEIKAVRRIKIRPTSKNMIRSRRKKTSRRLNCRSRNPNFAREASGRGDSR
jgi:hypothetical protein